MKKLLVALLMVVCVALTSYAADYADNDQMYFWDTNGSAQYFDTWVNFNVELSETDHIWTGKQTFQDIVLPAGGVSYEGLGDTAKFYSVATFDLNDPTTPSVLTIQETTNRVISNHKVVGADHVFTMSIAHAAGNVIFAIGSAFSVTITPAAGGLVYLNGVAKAVDEAIVNTAGIIGQKIVGYCVNINGSMTWMFYSSDTDWI